MTTVRATEHGDYHYDIVAHHRTGQEHVHPYASDEPLQVGDVVRLEGRFWLIESVEPDGEGVSGRAVAKPGRYRLALRHPDGREETGAFRRFRPDAPGLGHSFSTLEDGHPVSWEVVTEQPARDEQGEIYLELIAERDFAELEELPDHELEHALARREEEELPEGAAATLERAQQAGLSIELVALDPGEEPDWDEAERYIDALVLEEVEDDLLELCGVDFDRPRETWLATVKERLRTDLEQFRADVEGDEDEIERWSFRGGSIFVSVGTEDDESDPDKGHGWMARLVDSGVLGVAGFERVRKADIQKRCSIILRAERRRARGPRGGRFHYTTTGHDRSARWGRTVSRSDYLAGKQSDKPASGAALWAPSPRALRSRCMGEFFGTLPARRRRAFRFARLAGRAIEEVRRWQPRRSTRSALRAGSSPG
jgi:hypothetical protein